MSKSIDNTRLQLLHKTEALLDSLDSQKFSNFHPTRIFILFGASTAQPKEAYEILLPAASTGTSLMALLQGNAVPWKKWSREDKMPVLTVEEAASY